MPITVPTKSTGDFLTAVEFNEILGVVNDYFDNGIATSDIDTLAKLNAILADATLITDADARLSDARTPLSHTHVISDVTGLQAALDAKLAGSDIDTLLELNTLLTDATLIDTNDARLSDARTPLAHTHAISEVTNLQTTLDGKAATGHTHAIGDVTGLQTALDGKAATGHTHTEADITDLKAYLLATDINTLAKLNAILTDATLVDTADPRLSDSRDPNAHTHAASEITDFDAEVSNNASVSANTAKVSADGSVSTHSDVLSATEADRHALIYNATNSRYENRLLTEADISDLQSYALSGHSHVIADVTNLQTELDGKAAASHTHTAADITDFDTEVSNNASVTANTAKVSADGSVGTHSDVTIGAPAGSTAGTLRILADANQDGTYTVVDWTPPTAGSGEVNTASNLGAGEGLFTTKSGVDLPFKSLVGGTNVSLVSDANTVTINATDTNTQRTDEEIQDVVGAMATDSADIDFTYNDVAGTLTATIIAGSVDNASMANMATQTFKGRNAAGSGAPEDLSAATVRTMLNVEDGATADQTGAEIKSLYEAEANTNAFTDAEQTKLAGIEAGATADQSDAEIETAYNSQVAKVSAPEISAGTEVAVRRYSPADIFSFIDTHAIRSADIDTLAELNAIISDATLIDTNDPRLSDTRDPNAHTHAIADVTNLQTTLNGKLEATDIDTLVELNAIITDATLIDTNDPRLSDTRDPNAHTHTISDVTNLQSSLDAKLEATDIDTLTELNTILTDATLIDTNDSRLSDARTPTAHTHTASEVTDFDTEVSNNTDVASAKAVEDTPTTTLTLDKVAGRFSNMGAANAATSYSIAASPVLGAYCKVLINAATEPTVDNPDASAARKLVSPDFQANTDMYMHVIWNGTTRKADYYFTRITA